MGRGINPHRARALQRLDSLDDVKFSRRGFPNDRERAITATGEVVSVKLRGIDSCANREIGQDLAVIGIHHHELLRLSAADKQEASSRIH